MMALGQGVCSDETVTAGHPYLGRIGDRYVIVVPQDRKQRKEIPYKEATFYDAGEEDGRPLSDLHELAPIF